MKSTRDFFRDASLDSTFSIPHLYEVRFESVPLFRIVKFSTAEKKTATTTTKTDRHFECEFMSQIRANSYAVLKKQRCAMFGRILIWSHLFRVSLHVIAGFRLFFEDAREVHRIRIRMIRNNIDPQKLPYREMEKLRQVR